jgi:hypothetical protein
LGVIGIVIDVIAAGASATPLLDMIDHERKRSSLAIAWAAFANVVVDVVLGPLVGEALTKSLAHLTDIGLNFC